MILQIYLLIANYICKQVFFSKNKGNAASKTTFWEFELLELITKLYKNDLLSTFCLIKEFSWFIRIIYWQAQYHNKWPTSWWNLIFQKLFWNCESLCINGFNLVALVQLGQLIMYYTPKKALPFAFFLTYQAFKTWEGIVSQTNLAEWFKIWNLWVETNKNMDDL